MNAPTCQKSGGFHQRAALGRRCPRPAAGHRERHASIRPGQRTRHLSRLPRLPAFTSRDDEECPISGMSPSRNAHLAEGANSRPRPTRTAPRKRRDSRPRPTRIAPRSCAFTELLPSSCASSVGPSAERAIEGRGDEARAAIGNRGNAERGARNMSPVGRAR